ncbi:MAG: transposase [Pirellulales bacterium]
MSEIIAVGIDVSKAFLDVHILPSGIDLRVNNDPSGVDELVERLMDCSVDLVVLESTGGYERDVLYKLFEARVPVALANPRQVRDFAKALGMLAKTDRLDAVVLARFSMAGDSK